MPSRSKILWIEDGPTVGRKEVPAVHGVVGSEVVAAGKRNDGEVVVDVSLRFITNGF